MGECMVSNDSLVVDSPGPLDHIWTTPTHLICKFQLKFQNSVALVDGSYLLTTTPYRKWRQLHLDPPKGMAWIPKRGKEALRLADTSTIRR